VAIKRTLHLDIPFPALSTNKLYGGRKHRSFHYKKYRKDIFKFLKDNYPDPVNLKGNLVLTMEVGFSSSLSDLSNSVKGIEDCIASFYNFNDRQIISIRLEKYLVNKGDEYIKLKLRGSKRDIDRRVKYGRKRKG